MPVAYDDGGNRRRLFKGASEGETRIAFTGVLDKRFSKLIGRPNIDTYVSGHLRAPLYRLLCKLGGWGFDFGNTCPSRQFLVGK